MYLLSPKYIPLDGTANTRFYQYTHYVYRCMSFILNYPFLHVRLHYYLKYSMGYNEVFLCTLFHLPPPLNFTQRFHLVFPCILFFA
jgi:hypothetical protein